jgi:hypothetical protein
MGGWEMRVLTASWTAGCRPHVCAVGRYACEEDDEAVCADVGLGGWIAEGEGVCGFCE